jgi:hypothetical protein
MLSTVRNRHIAFRSQPCLVPTAIQLLSRYHVPYDEVTNTLILAFLRTRQLQQNALPNAERNRCIFLRTLPKLNKELVYRSRSKADEELWRIIVPRHPGMTRVNPGHFKPRVVFGRCPPLLAVCNFEPREHFAH